MSNLLMPNKTKKPRPYPCCNIPINMNIQRPRKDITIEVCRVCQRRHFTLKCDPLKLNVTGKEIMI